MDPRSTIRETQVLLVGGERLGALAREAEAVGDLPPIAIRRSDCDAALRPAAIDVVLCDPATTTGELRAMLPARRRHVGWVYVGVDAMPASALAEYIVLPADATPREVRIACVLVADADRWRRRLVRRARKEKRLRRLSLSDALTGLGNLRAWRGKLAAASRRVHDEGTAVCVALFDVDHFKKVNDERGHAVGDEVLKAVAARLLASVREGDFVARLGGDEFGVILTSLPAEHAGKIVDRVRQQVSASVVTVGGYAISVTASAGWSSIGVDDAADAVLERADFALRAAKQRGRNRTEASESDANPGGEERTG